MNQEIKKLGMADEWKTAAEWEKIEAEWEIEDETNWQNALAELQKAL